MRTRVRVRSVRGSAYVANTCSLTAPHRSLRSARSMPCARRARSCCSRTTTASTGRSTRTSTPAHGIRIERSCAGGGSPAARAPSRRPAMSACVRWSAQRRSISALERASGTRRASRCAPGPCARRVATRESATASTATAADPRRRAPEPARPPLGPAHPVAQPPCTCATSGWTRMITRCSPGWRKGYWSLPRYFLASESMCSSAPSWVRSATRPRTSRYS